jgi:hypothetical protein
MLPPTCALAAVVLVIPSVRPAEPLHPRIDRLIAAGFPADAEPAPRSSDAEFLRRVHLDLAGTPPTAAEVRSFLADADPKKREKLIDRLLDSPGYSRRMAWHFDVVLMERRRDSKVTRAAWEEFLRPAFASNTPYDEFVRQVLSSDGADPKTRPAAKFLLDRDLEPNLVTRDISRVFLGRNVQCAQCHDHPLVDDYKQADYYGVQAFVNRSFLFPSNTPAAVIAEKGEGDVTFVSVFDAAKKTGTAVPKLPGGTAVKEPTFEKGKEYKVAPARNVKPVPLFSRRAQLAANVTGSEAFARTAVNRLWAMMLGRGLIDPVDLDHSGNPPSHPELLDLLAREFAAHRFNVKWLVREIARSETYQRSSEGTADAPPDRYLAAGLKPLSPEQLAAAVVTATGGAESQVASQLPQFRRLFGAQPGQPEEFSASLDQTLFLKHAAAVRGLIAPRAAALAKPADPAAVADELFVAVLSRPPTPDEVTDVADALKGATDRPAAVADLVWALIASSEFRFNH